MKLDYDVILDENVDLDEWTLLLSECHQASYFQSPKGYQVLRAFSDWDARVIGLRLNGKLKALVVYVIQKEKGLKGFFSKRCIVFSGPLFTDDIGLQHILNVLDYKVSDAIYLEIRNGYSTELKRSLYQNLGWTYNGWLNFLVDTRIQESILKNMSESRRRQVKKAIKSGVECLNPVRLDEVKSFYGILFELYQSKVKKPLPSFELFKLFFESDPRNFILVYHKGDVIGGILCPFLEGVGLYEFYIAGKDEEFKDSYPSVMATYGAMLQAFELGLPKFDFMGGGSPEEGYGVREFKTRFGGEEVEWGRWIKVKRPFLYWLGKLYLNWKSKSSR